MFYDPTIQTSGKQDICYNRVQMPYHDHNAYVYNFIYKSKVFSREWIIPTNIQDYTKRGKTPTSPSFAWTLPHSVSLNFEVSFSITP